MKKEPVTKHSIPHEVAGRSVEFNCNLIGAWRRYRGLSEIELASKLGVTEQSLNRLENNEGYQKIDTDIDEIAAILNCTIQQLTM